MSDITRLVIGVGICVAVAVGFATVGEIAIFGFFALAYVCRNQE